jgi:ADP-heptose:LPS heptosyltransferase
MLRLTPVMNFLIFKVSHLGENIAFASVVQQLRRTFPDAGLTLFTTPESALLYGGPLAPTRVVATERSTFHHCWHNPAAFAHYWWQARKTRARACLLAGDQGNVAHLLAFLTVTPVLVGSAELNLQLPTRLSHTVRCPTHAKISAWHWELGRALTAAVQRYDWPMAMPPPDLSHLLSPLPPASRHRVVVDPGALLPYRRWPLENFLALAERLSRDFEVVWIDSAATRSTVIPTGIQRLPAASLAEFASTLAASRLFVGNHAASLQLASALGCPGVILAGPTHFEWDPTWHPERYLILRAKLPCLPCEKHRDIPGRCTNDAAPMACMEAWTLDAVETVCRDWIKRPHAPTGRSTPPHPHALA